MSSASENGTSTLQALSDDLAGAVERAGRSVVAIHARKRIPASGVLWRPGVVVATHHTIRRDQGIQVTLADGRSVPAELAGRDPSTDLAVLRLDSGDVAPAERADAVLKVGNLVLALGRPGDSVTASLGAVSAIGGEWRSWAGGRIDSFIRLDLSIYDGFSGGPLVDPRGRVHGINTSGLARGMPLTVPASVVDRVASQLLERGRVRRGYLGLGMQPVRLQQVPHGAAGAGQQVALMIVNVEPGGPAERAGILLGDILVALDGTPVGDPADVLALLAADPVGGEITARIIRAGSAMEIALTPGERPEKGG